MAVVGYASIFVARLMLSRIDYSRIDSFQSPLFATAGTSADGGFAHLADGGTTNFVGFGYDITMMKRIDVSGDGERGYQYGPVLRYRWNHMFFALPDVENVRFVPQTEFTNSQNAR